MQSDCEIPRARATIQECFDTVAVLTPAESGKLAPIS